jgi:tripartite-type tricarboxylate transporter receptor subunit TctC
MLYSSLAIAQPRSYPVRAIRVVVPYVPGGAVDAFVRPLTQKLHEVWGQPVIIDNRPGAGSNLGTKIVARAVADGYTLLGTSSVIAVNAALYRKLSFDALADLAPLGLVVQQPNVLAVHPSLPARNVKEHNTVVWIFRAGTHAA